MISTASAGTADRITARNSFNLLRAGSGTRAKYASTFLGLPLPLAEACLPRPATLFPLAEARLPLPADLPMPAFLFFMPAMLKTSFFKSPVVVVAFHNPRGLGSRIPPPATRTARHFTLELTKNNFIIESVDTPVD